MLTRAIFAISFALLSTYAYFTHLKPLGINVELTISIVLLVLVAVLGRGKKEIRVTFFLASLAQLRYLIWRLNCTLGFDNVVDNVASGLLIMADVYCTLMVLGGTFAYWYREPADRVLDFEIPEPPTRNPLVDIFITTYREPADVLRRTIAGALSVSYANKQIYLLDDGSREEIRLLAEEMGINYITRDGNTHFKAGNINNALSQTNGEFILSLDADHICASTIIDYALPTFIADEKVGLLQFAHRALNPSVLDRTLRYRGFATDLAAAYYVYLPSQKFWQGILWGGSGAVLRRAAMEDIGGVSVGSVTEDMHTSFTLFDHGWKIAYVPLPQIMAMSPETLSALLTQQKRWFTGAIQLNFGVKYWLYKNLTIPQRVLQMFNLVSFWSFFPRLIWITCPMLFTLFHIVPARMLAIEFLIGWSPLFYLSVRGNYLVARKNNSLVVLDLFDTLKGPAMLSAGFTMFMQGLVQPFRTTPKGMKDPSRSDVRLSIPYACMLVLAICAATSFLRGWISHPDISLPLLLFSWYYVFLLAGAVFTALEKPQPMAMHTVPADMPVTLSVRDSQVDARLLRVSESGGTVAVALPLQLDALEEFEISLRDSDKNVWREKVRFIGQKKLENGAFTVDLSFMPGARSAADFTNFIRLTICENKTWQVAPNLHQRTSMWNLIATPFRHLSRIVRKIASMPYQDFCLSDKPKRLASSSIIVE